MLVSELKSKPGEEIVSCDLCEDQLRNRQGQLVTVAEIVSSLVARGVPDNYTYRVKCNFCQTLISRVIEEVREALYYGLVYHPAVHFVAPDQS